GNRTWVGSCGVMLGQMPDDTSVVIAAGDDSDRRIVHCIHQAVGIVDTARPEPRKVFLQWFRLADTLERRAPHIIDELVDPLQRLSVLALPVDVIAPRFVGPTQQAVTHRSVHAASLCRRGTARWIWSDAPRWPANAVNAPSPSGCCSSPAT